MNRLFLRLMALLLIPSVMLCSLDIPIAHVCAPLVNTSAIDGLDDYLFSYDDVLHLIKEIEEGDLEERCTLEQLEKINQFLVRLARAGLLPDVSKEELEQDIEELLVNPSADSFSLAPCIAYNYAMVPAVCFSYGEVVLCKSWCKKAWKHTKKFVKKHKEAILIGVAVVVAAAVVACVVSAASAAAAVAGAAGSDALASPSDEKKDDSTQPQEDTASLNSQICPIQADPLVVEAIDEQIASIKEIVVDDSLLKSDYRNVIRDSSLGEKARGVGAYLAHQTLDGIGAFTAIIPEGMEEVRGIGSALLPEGHSFSDDNLLVSGSPAENWDQLVNFGHEKIDQLFSTDQAQGYSPEAKEANNRFSIGILPIPGMFSDAKKLAEAGKALDRAGFTKAGRALTKHSYREDSVFPKPVGNPTQVNDHGQSVLESILNHPERQVIQKTTKNFGEVVDICVPGIGGVRFTSSGEMIGFLEP